MNDLLRFQSTQGVAHSCIVAFSVYKNDNSSILDALLRLGGRGRAVACIDPETVTEEELCQLHEAGVRGVRINLKTTCTRIDTNDLAELLQKYARRIRPYNWAIQLFVALDQVPQLVDIVPKIGLPVILDHIADPNPSKGLVQKQEGYEEFMGLLRSGLVWTKLSGTYRFEGVPGLDEYVISILQTAPDRVVWASDWPHSGGVSANPGGDRNKVQDYRQIDDQAWIAKCKAWCQKASTNGEDLVRKIWVDNPRKLWQYSADD